VIVCEDNLPPPLAPSARVRDFVTTIILRWAKLPRGSNGAAQAAIDARTLADLLAKTSNPLEALLAYEKARLETTANVVRTNRRHPPDYINIKVDELTGGKPFECIDDVISQEELRKISEDYKKIAGFSLESLRQS